METPVRPVLFLLMGLLACAASLPATAAGLGMSRGGAVLSTEDEEQDAREIAARVNEALNIRREVTLTLLNDTTVTVTGRVAVQRYWLIFTSPDGSELRMRASMIASVRIR